MCGRLRKQTAQRNNFCPEQNIFFLYRPTDCGRVYTKGSRNVLYRHGLQGLSAEKVVLALYDLGQQTGQRSLAVLQAVPPPAEAFLLSIPPLPHPLFAAA